MEPIFLTASKPWGAYGPHPSCFVASNAGHYASNSELSLDHRSLRHQPLRHIPPQGDGVLDNGAKFPLSFVHTIARAALRHRTAGPTLKPSA
jgi:hypothetical protein